MHVAVEYLNLLDAQGARSYADTTPASTSREVRLQQHVVQPPQQAPQRHCTVFKSVCVDGEISSQLSSTRQAQAEVATALLLCHAKGQHDDMHAAIVSVYSTPVGSLSDVPAQQQP
eukprot:GHUV01052380.1.p1 GENE.GHUV01052380.1~~GHUV01052380.1.p1  ORF type:complete len:116 (-),score=15.83 GHUV01052380.1:279-626(-)